MSLTFDRSSISFSMTEFDFLLLEEARPPSERYGCYRIKNAGDKIS